MHFKTFLFNMLAVLFALSVSASSAQVTPAARTRMPSLSVGAGFSAYDSSFDIGQPMYGGTLWIDYDPQWLPHRLHGLGIEAEGRDISLHQIRSQPDMREDVASGGLRYTWHHFAQLRPYVKFMEGFGNAEYDTTHHGRYHQTRTVTTAGGGLEVPAFRNIWARADYEYQWWPDFWKNTNPAGKLTPQGFTFGLSYHFGEVRRR